jgi:hypothetical protein
MPQTIRKYWGAFQGRVSLNYNWPIINQDSVVLITAAEYLVSAPSSNEHRFIGDASITVENIAPHGPPYDSNHGVTFVVNVQSGSPVYIVTDITVLDNPPIEVDFFVPPTPQSIGNTRSPVSGAGSPSPPASATSTTQAAPGRSAPS